MPLAGARKSLNFFLKKILCRVPSGWHSAKFEFFLISLPSALWLALGKVWIFFKKIFTECHGLGTRQSWKNSFPSAHFSSFVECCDHGTRQRGPLPSATLGKVTQNGNFLFFLHSIMTNKFIQTYITYISHPSHIYLIHPHIHPHISHPSQYISHT